MAKKQSRSAGASPPSTPPASISNLHQSCGLRPHAASVLGHHTRTLPIGQELLRAWSGAESTDEAVPLTIAGLRQARLALAAEMHPNVFQGLTGGLLYQAVARTPAPAPRGERAPVPPPREPRPNPKEAEQLRARTDPAGVSLEARLLGKTTFPLDLRGLTPEQFRERIKPGPVVPAQPQVDLQLRVTNTSDKPLRLQVGGTANHLTLDLQGPGVVTIPALQRRLPRPAAQPPREVVVAAGETVTVLDIPRLTSTAGINSKLTYWTEAGEYALTAEYLVFVSPAPAGTSAAGDGFAPVKLLTPKFSIKVEAAGK